MGHRTIPSSSWPLPGVAHSKSESQRGQKRTPVKPPQHWQVKPPAVLTQVLLAPQLLVPRTHSLMSISHWDPSYLEQ